MYILFIVCFIVGWILSANKYGAVLSNSTRGTGLTTVSASELFIHNEGGGILTYFSSVFFGIPAILLLVFNAVGLGSMGQLFNTMMPNGAIKYIVYLIPHGIFEITATVIESVAGILLFLFIWRFIKAMLSNESQGFKDSFEKTKKVLIQSIILMIFSTILLLIAAPIEAYVSIPLSEFILGF